jgi:hypothetical protein
MHPETPFRVAGALLFSAMIAVALPHRIRAPRLGVRPPRPCAANVSP